MSSSNCCFLTCIQISQEGGQVVWYSHLFKNFPQFVVIHTIKGFGVVNKAVQFSRSVVSNSLWPHGLQNARLPCPSPTPGVHSNLCPLSQWCHPTISFSVIPSSSSLQSSALCIGDQSIGASALASVLLMNIQDWFPLELTGLFSVLSKGLSRVFSNTTVQKHQFFNAQPSLWSNSHIHTWLLKKP